jgi:branched-chain amino acid aminotransferase
MINFNGDLIYSDNLTLTKDNRAFKYGDGIFETVKVLNNNVVFWEDHYFRLMSSMRMLRMKIPMSFTLEFLEEEILKTVKVQEAASSYRIRLNVYRKDGGFYTPSTNKVDYLIEASPIEMKEKGSYTIDLFKDFYNYSGMLSTIKTNNRILNTLASVFADENELDNAILLNENKGVAEVTNGNIFIIKDKKIKTPALSQGCIKGIIRAKVIEMITSHVEYEIEETTISPFEIQKADEVFITNAISGIQTVTNYRKKEFSTEIGDKLSNSLRVQQVVKK